MKINNKQMKMSLQPH